MSGAAQAADWAPSARTWIGFGAMVFGMFMAILDIQIVSASLAEIQAGLSASADEVSWVQTSYLIAEIVMIPLSGWLSRLLSTRILFVGSALGFTLASFACAFSTNLEMMILFRALQGFIGGAMIPTVFATAFGVFPPRQRALTGTVVGLTATLAPTIGPTLGGWLTQALSWHWLFLINVPFGILVAAGVWMLLDIDKPNWKLRGSFDWTGMVLMAGFLGSLEYVLEEGNQKDWFADSTIVIFAAISAISSVLFVWRMLSRPEPLVDLRAFANANFAFGSVFSFVTGVGLYGSVYVLPLFLGRVRGYDSLQIGETLFVAGVAQFFAAPLVANLTAKLDMRLMLAFGLALFGFSLWDLAALSSQSAFWEMFWPQVLRGFALMFIMVPISQIALATLPPQQVKNASGLFNLMRNLGGAVGLAMINLVATERFAFHMLHLREQVGWAHGEANRVLAMLTQAFARQPGIDATGAALKKLMQLTQQQALALAYNDVLVLMALAFIVPLPLLFFLARPKASGAPVEAH